MRLVQSGSVSDAANLESLGIPTVTFVTAPFERAACFTAAALGMADLPLIVVAHDYFADTEAQMKAVAALTDRVVAELFGVSS
ncbi:MAG: hypothetical protein U0W40_19270 [Acidimicrobiia bacterium]